MPRKTKTQTQPQITVDDALRALRADYFAKIRSIALEALNQPEDDRDDWLHETLDGHEYVIYTYKARVVLVCTDHPDVYKDEMGEEPETPEQAAYMAMRADVDDLLSDEYFIRDAKGEE